MISPLCGLSLREQHFSAYKAKKNRFQSIEVVAENYMYTEGERRDLLRDLSKDLSIHLHGTTLNIGSTDPLNLDFLAKLRTLATDVKAFALSDHLCFTQQNQRSSFELLPLPRTMAMIQHVGDRLNRVRDILGRELFLENISSYFSYEIDQMSEIDFLLELHDRFQLKLLFDVNNFYVNARNFSFSDVEAIRRMQPEMVGLFHLGGHLDMNTFLFDDHGHAVSEPVWSLYNEAIKVVGARPTFLERDENVPAELDVLEAELSRAQEAMQPSALRSL